MEGFEFEKSRNKWNEKRKKTKKKGEEHRKNKKRREKKKTQDTNPFLRAVYTKIQCYIQIAEENIRNPNEMDSLYPFHCNIYVPRAVVEFKTFLDLCDQWETKRWKKEKKITKEIIKERMKEDGKKYFQK